MKRFSFGLVSRLLILLVATVVVAQLINSVILIGVAHNLRMERTQAVLVERVVQGARIADFAGAGRRNGNLRRGFRLADEPPNGGERQPRVERMLAASLEESGLGDRNHQVVEMENRGRAQMVAAVELESGRWLLLRVPSPRSRLPWDLVGLQTLVLTVVLLIPAVWVSAVVATPLKRVTAAAENFLTGAPSEALPKGGPPDIQALCRGFEALEQRILSALEERSVMLGAIGHDLRTPLASLRIRVESVDDEELREGMIQSIEGLAAALDDILTFSSDIKDLKFEAVRTEALLSRLEAIYDEDALKIEPSASYRLRCAPESVLRAIRNLIDNAVRYGEVASLTVGADDQHIVFTVSDQGAGMAEEDIERMQQPFTRADGSRNRSSGGSGLGLAIVRAVATAHDGAVSFRNQPSGGLAVSLRLPRIPEG